ncbi:MAG TPA: alcohol dehydrogenase catalytic domain-containing protein [Candidatus Paceibacterota bacterium]|nr:alcohol dehydrogenase catalytic domain-containing protein [Candidatus Paceibacterota bacterium]
MIPKTMRAAVYRGPNDLRSETVPVPRIGPNDLLVKVAVCGVCPTDIKKIQYGTVPPPRIFGHETAGTIVKIGGGRSELQTSNFKLRIGDRVALHHHVPCLRCHACRHGAFAQCETYKKTGITAGFEPAGGGFAEYVRVMPVVLPGVVKIPGRNSFEEGAMLEPVNTVLKAVKRLALLPGDNVLVAGQGPIGLMFTRLLQLQGMNVLATDLLDARLRLARQFGAKWAVKPTEIEKIQNSKFKTQKSLDAAVLAVPSDDALRQAMQLVRGAGQILLFAHTKRATGAPSPWREGGVGEQAGQAHSRQDSADHKPGEGYFPLDLATICVDEKDLIGSYSADFTLQKEVARLVFSRKLDVRPLISHRFDLDQAADAVNLAASPTPDSLKVLVQSARV